jgi:DNA processing protein
VEEALWWIALRDTPGLSRLHAQALLERWNHPEQIFERLVPELGAYCAPAAARQLARPPRLDEARAEHERARQLGLRVLPRSAPDFPASLRAIPDPPLLLYARGELGVEPRVAIVGARRASAHAREASRAFAASLAASGVSIVSGLAFGVDAAAHSGALEGGGHTLAVLASGLDRPSPGRNVDLAQHILRSGGGWLSEHPPGIPALPYHFPERNRLISGLARLTLVVEARVASGTLWTARHALDQGRRVMVVPGPIDRAGCAGSNALLRDGASPVLEPADLLTALALEGLGPERARRAPACPVLEQLEEGPTDSDELCRALGLPPETLAARLLELELDGQIERQGRRIALRRSGAL